MIFGLENILNIWNNHTKLQYPAFYHGQSILRASDLSWSHANDKYTHVPRDGDSVIWYLTSGIGHNHAGGFCHSTRRMAFFVFRDWKSAASANKNSRLGSSVSTMQNDTDLAIISHHSMYRI